MISAESRGRTGTDVQAVRFAAGSVGNGCERKFIRLGWERGQGVCQIEPLDEAKVKEGLMTTA